MNRTAPWYIVALLDADGYVVTTDEVQGLAPAKLRIADLMRDADYARDAVRATVCTEKGECLVDVRK